MSDPKKPDHRTKGQKRVFAISVLIALVAMTISTLIDPRMHRDPPAEPGGYSFPLIVLILITSAATIVGLWCFVLAITKEISLVLRIVVFFMLLGSAFLLLSLYQVVVVSIMRLLGI